MVWGVTALFPSVKPQKHDIVHVEIWLGEGEKTLGARWQKGRYTHTHEYPSLLHCLGLANPSLGVVC